MGHQKSEHCSDFENTYTKMDGPLLTLKGVYIKVSLYSISITSPAIGLHSKWNELISAKC